MGTTQPHENNWGATPVYKIEINDRGGSLRWPRDNLYTQKLALTSPTSDGRSVGIVRLRTKATEFYSCENFYQIIHTQRYSIGSSPKCHFNGPTLYLSLYYSLNVCFSLLLYIFMSEESKRRATWSILQKKRERETEQKALNCTDWLSTTSCFLMFSHIRESIWKSIYACD
jgi:hypothetical protein